MDYYTTYQRRRLLSTDDKNNLQRFWMTDWGWADKRALRRSVMTNHLLERSLQTTHPKSHFTSLLQARQRFNPKDRKLPLLPEMDGLVGENFAAHTYHSLFHAATKMTILPGTDERNLYDNFSSKWLLNALPAFIRQILKCLLSKVCEWLQHWRIAFGYKGKVNQKRK